MPTPAKYQFTTLKAVASFFGVSYSTVEFWRQKQGMPGEANKWDVREIARWFAQKRKVTHVEEVEKNPKRGSPKREGAQDPFTEEDMLSDSAQETEALEKFRHERWLISRLQRKEKEGGLVQVAEVQKWLGDVAMVIRAFGEQLEKEFGREAVEMHDEMCDSIDELIRDK